MLAAYTMFGHQLLLPVPDLDRTDFFLILGGNPVVSNGSLMTAPGMKGRLEATGMPVERVVAGGSFTFPYYARAEGFHGSPGTVVYWDINGTSRMADLPGLVSSFVKYS